MAINVGSIITWSDLAARCYAALVSQCCNVDSYKNVPAKLQSGSGQVAVRTISNIGISGSKSTKSATWYANPGNLISIVSSSTVSSEWNTFLANAGINARSNELIKGKELGLVMSLYMQFLSYHLKPVYSRRQIYNTVESQGLFQGIKYVTGTCTPYYNLRSIDVDNYDPVILTKNNYMLEGTCWGMFTAYDNPVHPYNTLS